MRSELEIPEAPQYLAIAAISHDTGQLILPTFLRGGTVHLLKRFDPTEVWAAAGSVDTDLSFLSFLELYGTEIAERRMPARRVVEALDVVEHI